MKCSVDGHTRVHCSSQRFVWPLGCQCFFRVLQMCQRVYFFLPSPTRSHTQPFHIKAGCKGRVCVEEKGRENWVSVVSKNKSKRLRRSTLFLLYLLCLLLPCLLHCSKLRYLLVFCEHLPLFFNSDEKQKQERTKKRTSARDT